MCLVVEGCRKIRFEAHGPLKALDGLIVGSAKLQGIAAQQPGVRIHRLQPNQGQGGRRGGGDLPCANEDARQAEIRGRLRRIHGDCAVDQGDGVRNFAAATGHYAQQMQGIVAIGPGGEHAAVKEFGPLQLAAPMMLDGGHQLCALFRLQWSAAARWPRRCLQGVAFLVRSCSARSRYSSTRFSMRERVIRVKGSAELTLVNSPTFS